MQSIGKSKYVGESTLYGAIYSTNIESYNCGLRKALVRLQKIAEIYKQKSMELGNLDTGCDEYGSMLSLINNIYSVADDLNIDQAQIIYENSKSLKEKNHALKINSCPTLY